MAILSLAVSESASRRALRRVPHVFRDRDRS